MGRGHQTGREKRPSAKRNTNMRSGVPTTRNRDKGESGKGASRIKKLQKFKQRYGIKVDGSVEDGIRDLQIAIDVQPGFLLSLGKLEDGTHVISTNYAKLLARRKNEEGYAIALRGGYYILQACQQSIESIRQGYICLIDLDGVGPMNLSMKLEERMAELYSDSYPIRVQKICMMNAGFFMRVFNALLSVFTSKKIMKNRIMTGKRDTYLQASPQYHRDILPKEWGGTQDAKDLMEVFATKLKERYDLASSFRL